MTTIETFCWNAITELLPTVDRDYRFSIYSEPDGSKPYKCTMKFEYNNDTGEMLAALVDKNLNDTIRKLLRKQIEIRGKSVESFDKSYGDAKFVDIVFTDNRNNKTVNVEEIMQGIDKNAPEKQQAQTQNQEAPKEISVEELHWSSVFKNYLRNPNAAVYEDWVLKLIVVEINRRLVEDRQQVLNLPESFEKDWLETVDVLMSKPVTAKYSALFKPSEFKSLIDDVYSSLKAVLSDNKIYNGTARVLFYRKPGGTIELEAVCLTTYQQEEVKQ